jgi:hypothetical protein
MYLAGTRFDLRWGTDMIFHDFLVLPWKYLDQSGPTFSFPWAKNSFAVGTRSQETLLETIFKTNSQFSFSLTIFIQG